MDNSNIIQNENNPDTDNNFQLETYKNTFQLDLIEKIMAFAIWPIAFIYVSSFWEYGTTYKILFGISVASFLAVGEAMYWKRKRTFESTLLFCLTLMCLFGSLFDLCEDVFNLDDGVWSSGLCVFFTHLFATYWILCRSDRLAEGQTSHMFLWDGITGFFVMTFKNMHLSIYTMINTVKSKKNINAINIFFGILAAFVGFILLVIALAFLNNSDLRYSYMLEIIFKTFFDIIDFALFWKIVFTVFFASYFYGLIGGCYRESSERVRNRGNYIKKILNALKKVPSPVWVVTIALFSIFYVLYFVVQGSYLFDAFYLKLPAEFTYSEYARHGFGDMCGVMIVNFIVLWIATRTSNKMNLGIKIACVALTIESILFSIIAFLKLFMYIRAYDYGFTPLRLQSGWLICVLFLACICTLISLLAEKKTARIWFLASASSLAALCIL